MPKKKHKKDPLLMHERVFAQVLGIQEDERFRDELSAFAKELLYILPPGYTMTVNEGELAGIPMFVEEGSQESFWNHPYEEEMRQKVEDLRNKLTEERADLSLSTLAENSVSQEESPHSKSPPRSARSLKSDLSLSSMKSMVTLEQHEMLFGQALGIDPEEPHCTVLLYFAKELMGILPEGWEMQISITDSGAKIPYFIDTVNNISSWKHPYEEQYLDLVRNNRQQLVEANQQQMGNLYDVSSQRSSPRSSLKSQSPRANVQQEAVNLEQAQVNQGVNSPVGLAESSRGPSMSKLELVEIQFAVEAMGVDLQEEFAADLLDYARELLQILPEGWEFVIAETDEGNLFPLFLNKFMRGADGEPQSQLEHPMAEEHRLSVAEVRHVLTYGELPPNSQLAPEMQQQMQLSDGADVPDHLPPNSSPSTKHSSAIAAQRVIAKSRSMSMSFDAGDKERGIIIPPLERSPSVRVSTPPVEARKVKRTSSIDAPAVTGNIRVISPTADLVAMNASKKELRQRGDGIVVGDDSSVVSDITAPAPMPGPPASTPPLSSQKGRDNTKVRALSFSEQVESTAEAVVGDWMVNGVVTYAHHGPKHKEEKRPKKLSRLEDTAVEPVFDPMSKSFSLKVLQQVRDGDSDSQHSASTESSRGPPLIARQPSNFSVKLNNVHEGVPVVDYLESGSFEGFHDSSDNFPPDDEKEMKEASSQSSTQNIAALQDNEEDEEVVAALKPSASFKGAGSSDSQNSSPLQRPNSRQMLAEMRTISFRNTIDASLSLLDEEEEDNDQLSGRAREVQESDHTESPLLGASDLDSKMLEAMGVDSLELEKEIDDTSLSVMSPSSQERRELNEVKDEPEAESSVAEVSNNKERKQVLERQVQFEKSTLKTSPKSKFEQVRFDKIDMEAASASEFSFGNALSGSIEDEDDGINYDDDDNDIASTEHFSFPNSMQQGAEILESISGDDMEGSAVQSGVSHENDDVPVATPLIIPPDPPVVQEQDTAIFLKEFQDSQKQQLEQDPVKEEPQNLPPVSNSEQDSGRRSSKDVLEEFHSLFKEPEKPKDTAATKGILQPNHKARPSASFVLSVAQGNSIRVSNRNLDMLRSSKSKDRKDGGKNSVRVMKLSKLPSPTKKSASVESADEGSGKIAGIAMATDGSNSKGKELQPLRKGAPQRLRTARGSPSAAGGGHRPKSAQSRASDVAGADTGHTTKQKRNWHILGCYPHYNQALTSRKIIEKLVVADSKGTIVFDPRVTFFEEEDDQEDPARADAPRMLHTSSVAGSSTLHPTTNLMANSNSWPVSRYPDDNKRDRTITGLGESTGGFNSDTLPAANDTAELILGRVKRTTEKLSKLRVRKDLGRMQWVVETDDPVVVSVANRRRKKKGVNLESDNGAMLAIKSAAATSSSMNVNNTTEATKKYVPPPKLPPIRGRDAIKKAFSRSKTFGVIAKMQPSGDGDEARKRYNLDGREVVAAADENTDALEWSKQKRSGLSLANKHTSSTSSSKAMPSSSLLEHFNLMKEKKTANQRSAYKKAGVGLIVSNSAGDSGAMHLGDTGNQRDGLFPSLQSPSRHIYSS